MLSPRDDAPPNQKIRTGNPFAFEASFPHIDIISVRESSVANLL
jgi:hypothetical protein